MYFNLLECDYTVGTAATDILVTDDHTYNAFSTGSITTSVLHKIGTDADACWKKSDGGNLKIGGSVFATASFTTQTDTDLTFDLAAVTTAPTANSDLVSGAGNA